MASVVQRFIDCEGWRVLLFLGRLLLALTVAAARRARRVLRASPRLARNFVVSCTVLLVAFLVNTRLVVSVDGAPMATRVEMARSIVYSMPMAPEARQAVTQACIERHNERFWAISSMPVPPLRSPVILEWRTPPRLPCGIPGQHSTPRWASYPSYEDPSRRTRRTSPPV